MYLCTVGFDSLCIPEDWPNTTNTLMSVSSIKIDAKQEMSVAALIMQQYTKH